MSRSLLSSLLLLCALPLTAQTPAIPGLPEAARKAADSISPDRISAHVRFLANDLLEGRGPGQRGGEIAAQYIATQFALNGLKPAGDNGTYFQRVPLYAVHTDEQKTRLALVSHSGQRRDLAYTTEIVTKDQSGQSSAEIDAPIVFVGYGIHAPEYHWDDYAGIDLHGKIALVIVNEPPSNDAKFFTGKALTYYGRWTYKYEEAARRGALGVLLIHRTDLASYGWEVVRNSQAIEKSYLEGDPLATLRAASWITHPVAQELFTMAGLGDLDQAIAKAGTPGAFHPVELPIRLSGHVESKVRRYVSANIVGYLPGSEDKGTESRNAVFYTAHYDHLGIDPTAKEDGIYNGAADNGTGCGVLLELARVSAEATARPPHATYFAAVTAEEQGMLGSQFLGMKPPIPAREIGLDLNFDMILPLGIPRSVNLGGAERLSLWPTIQKVAKDFDLAILPDPRPEAGSYYRSDHFSFARTGIPAFSVDEGTLFEGHDEAWGRAQLEDFEEHHYHQPSDEWLPTWDFRGNAKLARFGLALGWLVSAQPSAVAWQPGDEFEAARKQSER